MVSSSSGATSNRPGASCAFRAASSNTASCGPRGPFGNCSEETGLIAEPDDVHVFDVQSTGRHVLVFGILPARPAADLPPSAPTGEATEWIVTREPLVLAFPTHTAVLDKFFADR